ncbi:MAG: methyltransferase domain-containing protein [Planctomycetes bacterium]|nr:methyltransferase domain-containing protein [Planctomycetota bacterium]
MAPVGPSPALFFETMNAFQRTAALRTAIELDLFTHVHAGRRTVTDLAAACQAAPRGIRILADFLTMLGFLKKEVEAYELSDDARFFLVRSSPAYLGNAVDFLLSTDLQESFRRLPDAVRRGGTAISEDGTVSHDNPIWVDFARAMAPLMQMPARLLAGLVDAPTDRPLRVLDIAAGHGLYGIAVAEAYPQAHVTALDWPNVLQVAQENATRAGIAGRYTLLPGSAFDVDWGGPYDVVLLTNFLHHFDVPTCDQLAARAFAALAPGGRAMTLEFIPNPDRISPPGTANFAIVMLATTARGDAYTFPELAGMFTRAGFTRNEFHPLPPTTQQAVVSYKP